MAKKKRRKSKKNNKGNITLAIMLAVIFIIIGIFVFKAINKDSAGGETVSTTEAIGDYYQGGESDNTASDDVDNQDKSEDDSQAEETTEDTSLTTFEELTTEPLTLPMNNEPESMVDVILAHYTDLMGFPEGALFINENETEETAGGYTYTLRLNANGSPNELIGDVYVEKGTGAVTDSMGNEPWNIED